MWHLRSTRISAPAATLLLIACAGCGDPTGPEGLQESAQMLANGDMESGAIEPSVWWNGSQSRSDFVFEWSSTEAASGTRSLALTDASGSTADFAYWGQRIEVDDPTGMTLELSVSVKLNDVQGEGVSIAIRGDDTSANNGFAEEFATTQGTLLIDGTQDWTTHSVQLSGMTAAIDVITVYFVYLRTNTGAAYFDDAVLSASRTN